MLPICVLKNTRCMPSLVEMSIFFLMCVRIVNGKPLTTVGDQPNDLLSVTRSLFLEQDLAPNAPRDKFHDKKDLRKDFLHNDILAHRFWLRWMASYYPSLQGRSKSLTIEKNFTLGQLVLVGDAEDLFYRGLYCLDRIHSLYPQIRKGKEIIRCATCCSSQ